MDYGSLIRRSWSLTWRHRFLWVLGLFATGGASGSCSTSVPSGGGGSPGGWAPGTDGIPPELERAVVGLGTWIAQNLWLIGLAMLGLVLLFLLFLVLSLIAQGATARATADLALGQPSSLGGAWRAGGRLFWRYLGLWLVLFGLGLAVLLVVGFAGLVVALLFGLGDGGSQAVLILVAVLLGLLLLVVAIPVFIGLSVVVALAQRAIAVEDVGPLPALGAGLRLVRAQLGTSALAWLIQFGLSIAAGLALLLGLALFLVPLGLLGLVLYAAVGLSVELLVYAVVALLVLGIVGWLLSGVANAYFWSYWTLVYLRFTGRLSDRLEAVVP
jgi:hypothetical protein